MEASSATWIKKFIRSKMFTLLLLLILIIVFFTIVTNGQYIGLRNIKNIFASLTVAALLTIGAGCLIISGQMDLSTGALGTSAALVFGTFLTTMGMPWPVALLLALILCALFGLMNAALINELGFPGFITTMASASIATGAGLIVTGAKAVKISDEVIVYIGTGKIFNGFLPISIFIALAAFIGFGVMLKKTKFGRSIYLVGGNAQAARLAGLNPKRVSYILFANSSVMGGLAGILLAASLKSATNAGVTGNQFTGMTAAILGGVSFGGGAGGMGGAFMGLLILNAFNNGMTTIPGLDSFWRMAASGALLLFALTLDVVSQRSARTKRGK
jgi:ribose/xylose/arabinose/galactoside ABC-type transport system permease subunit